MLLVTPHLDFALAELITNAAHSPTTILTRSLKYAWFLVRTFLMPESAQEQKHAKLLEGTRPKDTAQVEMIFNVVEITIESL